MAVVATLPASHLEVASSDRGQEILNSLERRFGRMSADVKPVADDEIYEVVRRRLFENVGDPKEHDRVADAYLKMYQQHKNEVPADVTRAPYKDRLIAATSASINGWDFWHYRSKGKWIPLSNIRK